MRSDSGQTASIWMETSKEILSDGPNFSSMSDATAHKKYQQQHAERYAQQPQNDVANLASSTNSPSPF